MTGRKALNPGWLLVAGLFPLGAGAVAVSLFFASLILNWVGMPVLAPTQAVAGGLILGLPATWTFARHIRRLRVEAAARP